MKNVLIVIDMQNDFVNGSLGTKEAQGIVENVKKKIQEFDGSIIFTRDTHSKEYLKTQEGKNLPIEHCIKETTGWEIVKELNKIREEKKLKTFDKETFGSKELAQYLFELNKTEKISKIEFIGLCTDICVISNALLIKAFLPEAEIIVDADCCAGVTKESHKNALKAMEMCQVKIIESKKAIKNRV